LFDLLGGRDRGTVSRGATCKKGWRNEDARLCQSASNVKKLLKRTKCSRVSPRFVIRLRILEFGGRGGR
jgi:hypothetical protein